MDIPPSTVDVERIVRAGQVRVQHRQAIATLAVLAIAAAASLTGWRLYAYARIPARPAAHNTSPAVVASTTPATPIGPCTVRALPVPKGLVPYDVHGMDPSGRYIVADTFDARHDSSPVSILWDNGVPSVIPVGGSNSFAFAVNIHGTVVGTGERTSGVEFPWIYADGKVTDLPAPAGYPHNVTPVGINARGDVVGTAADGAFNQVAPVLWPAGNRAGVHVLPVPTVSGASSRTQAIAIADDGTVVATIGDVRHRIPYAWDADGHGRHLDVPKGAVNGEVVAVSGGWAFGRVDRPEAGVSPGVYTNGPVIGTPARWSLRTGAVTLPAPDRHTGAVAGNAAGDLILRGYPDGEVYLHAGTPVELPDLLPGSAPHLVALDATGHLVAGNAYKNPTEVTGVRQPVLWRC
jgi:uncharacterized membrane protein